MPIISVKGLTKRFGSRTAVNGIDLSVVKGEILGLLGPNGAGKTTTIQMLLGLVLPTAGQIRILGMDIARSRREILSRVNFSSAYSQLPPNLTVWENMNVFGKLYGIRHNGPRIRELLDFFNIGHVLGRRTGSLSSGQITRLNLAKALLNDPEILFLDEPTSSLDPEIAERVRNLLHGIQRDRGITIIYTSHNMYETESLCNRILFMAGGNIILEGTPESLKKQSMAGTLEDVFIAVARGGDLRDVRNRKS